MNLDSSIVEVLNQFKKASIEAYVVGGYIRDLLLGKKSFDVDICFNGSTETVIDLFKVYEMDLSALKYHSISFSIGEMNFECTHLRVEGPSLNHRHPSTINLTNDINKDIKRRDFTMNAIYYHLDKGIIDPCNGMHDIEKKQIKTIIEAEACFNEDYLRVFRGIRFQSQLGFDFEIETLNALKKVLPSISGYPVVWWEKEFIKLLMGPFFLQVALALPEFFETLFGHYLTAYDFDQRNPYHQYSLYEHTMRVVSEVGSDVCLKMAALFHDIGKLYTEVHDELGVSHYQGHAEKSAEISGPIIEKFSFKNKDKQRILNVIRYHGIKMSEGFINVYLLAYQYGYDLLLDIIEIKRADNLSKSPKAYYQVEKCQRFNLDMIRIKKEDWPLKVTDLKVDGNDCLNLGVKQEKISIILRNVLDRVVKNEVGNSLEKQMEILQEVVSNDIY